MSVRPYRDINRRKSRQIHVGSVPVGGDAPITVQSMTNTLTHDVKATVEQIQASGARRRRHRARLLPGRGIAAGAEGHRAPGERADRRRHPFPLQARDRGGQERRRLPAHQSRQYRLGRAREARWSRPPRITAARCASASTPARWRSDLLERYGEPCPEAMVESALTHAKILEDNDFFEFKICVQGVGRVPRRRRLSAARRGVRLPAASRHHRGRRPA